MGYSLGITASSLYNKYISRQAEFTTHKPDIMMYIFFMARNIAKFGYLGQSVLMGCWRHCLLDVFANKMDLKGTVTCSNFGYCPNFAIEKARNEMMGRFLGSLDGTTLDI